MRHGSLQTCIFHTFYPAWPSIMAASVRMYERPFTFRQLRYCLLKHRIDKYGIRCRAYSPTGNHAIKAIHKCRKIELTNWKDKLCNVGQPFLIWLISMKIPFYFVGYRWGYFSLIGTILSAPFAADKKNLLPA